MGGACCKKLDSPTSPHLPFCEVLRRCARLMCPLDPPRQKATPRARKYGLSDIVGPVMKKDSWAQTDPLPPPRRKKKYKGKRRRSRSVEFLPYFLEDSRISGSLENIAGQEDAIDFQMYFMSRLPRNSITSCEEGKDSITGRKKEFLSTLLGVENNNQNLEPTHTTFEATQSTSKLETVPALTTESSSRRSSITESLKEFESSLFDMLQDVGDDEDDVKSGSVKEPEPQRFLLTMPPVRDGALTPLQEEKEEDYVLTPLEEEEEDDIWNAKALINNSETNKKKKDRCKVIILDQEETKGNFENENLANNIKDISNEKDDPPEETQVEQLKKKIPPITITIETVS